VAHTLITGGAGHLGFALGQHFVKAGDQVSLVDINPDVRERAEAIGAVGIVADLTVENQMPALRAEKPLDALVCAVGAWPRISWEKLTTARWRELIDINLTSAYLAVQATTEALVESRGSVVLVGSAIALKGNPEMAHYAAAKAGQQGLAKSLALSLGPHGVRVNVVAPGLIETPDADTTWSMEQKQVLWNQRAMPGPLEIGEVVDAIAFFCSPQSRGITGQVLVVDRGVVLH